MIETSLLVEHIQGNKQTEISYSKMSEDIQLFSSSHRTEQFHIRRVNIQPGIVHKPSKPLLIPLSLSQVRMGYSEELCS